MRKIGLRRRTCLFACAVAFALTASGQNLRTQVTNFSVTNVTLKEALQDGASAAEQGVAYTKTIIATKGRASYLGERSLGHQDPGATSSWYMLRTMAEHIDE